MGDVFSKNQATTAEEAAKIVPRAEFRVFGKDVISGVVDHMWKAKAQLFKARVMPEETYILSKATNDANVKVRDGLLDIKTKTGETPEGFEIFQPRGKFQFPVAKTELETILGHLGTTLPLEKDNYTFDEFCALVKASHDLALVKVEKMRYGFSVNSVICEYAKVWFNGALVETACCESEDYAAMADAVKALGIENEPNVNYLKAAKHVIGWA